MRDLELWLYFIAFGQGLTVHPCLAWYLLCVYSKGVQAGLRPCLFAVAALVPGFLACTTTTGLSHSFHWL